MSKDKDIFSLMQQIDEYIMDNYDPSEVIYGCCGLFNSVFQQLSSKEFDRDDLHNLINKYFEPEELV